MIINIKIAQKIQPIEYGVSILIEFWESIWSTLVELSAWLFVGAFVSGMDAGKIYNTWPLMGNSYFPNDNNFLNLFKLAALSDPSLVQFIHRN